MKRSQNGWPVIEDPDEIRTWIVPGTSIRLPLPYGAVGLVLVHLALWWHETIEPLDNNPRDDWGWAVRLIAGSDVYSNHGSGAVDLNATKHPQGVPTRDTLTVDQVNRIHRRLKFYRVLGWGGDYVNRPDAMHFEIVKGRRQVRAVALALSCTPRGRRVRAANPKEKP